MTDRNSTDRAWSSGFCLTWAVLALARGFNVGNVSVKYINVKVDFMAVRPTRNFLVHFSQLLDYACPNQQLTSNLAF